MEDLILKMEKITKVFGGVTALNKVDFELRRGEIHALIGENGAGKSTLMKVLLGIHQADGGKILYDGKEVNFRSPAEALKNKISMIHQEISLVPDLDVAENIWMGREDQFINGVFISNAKRYEVTQQLLDQLGIPVNPRSVVRSLSVAEMQLVEVARAVSIDPKIIIMDEPTSALTDVEVDLLFKVIRDLAAKSVSVIFISHKLEEIFEICDRTTIFRDGTYVGVRNCDHFSKQELINLMVGRKVDKLFDKEEVEIGDVALEVEHLSTREMVDDVSFKVHKGEVYGFCGLMGAGRSEIVRAIFGIDQKSSGRVLVDGKETDIHSPGDAINCGLGMVTEDRLRMGVISTMSVKHNMTLSFFKNLCNKLGFSSVSKEKKVFDENARALTVKYGNPDDLIGSLSGGNQQKVVIARWLMTNPHVLILDEPTRGIDVGAKAEIYKLINDLARQGLAVVMISSELPELLALCDRIAVVKEGRIVTEMNGKQATQESLMSHAF